MENMKTEYDSICDAMEIILRCRLQTTGTPAWAYLYHAGEYLNNQANNLFREMIGKEN